MTQVTKAALLARVETLEKALADSLEQQTATSEILRVISSSPTDAQPVFESIAASAHRLCGAKLTTVFRFDGRLIHIAALHDVSTQGAAAYRDAYPAPPGRGGATHRAILTRSIVHIPDIREDPEYELQGLARAADYGSALAVPMLREGHPIGAITVGREAATPFPDEQIELLRTFADQAVIAIENVRLFKELEARNRDLIEALEQQTATAEILRVISTSPTDLQPVLDTVVKSAARFCGAYDASMFRLDAETLRVVAHHGPIPHPVGRLIPVIRGTISGRAVLERRAVHVTDIQAEVEGFPEGQALAHEHGWRTILSVPLLREGASMGTIVLRRAEMNPFTDKQIALLHTFADQAVIAIENVRLFTELQEKNRALTATHAQVSEALEQQTATSEILRVISHSPTDVQPVFDVIVERAVRLCGARFGRVYRYDGRLIHMVAGYGLGAVGLGVVQQVFPRPASDETIVGRVILTREPALMRDIEREEGVPALSRRMIEALETRSQVTIPMLRAGAVIGAMTLGWAEPEAFDEQQIALLKTFADQAVIAIENVRLFKELEARNRDLTATSQILQVISRSPTDVQPVFEAIADSAMDLFDALGVAVVRYNGELISMAAARGGAPGSAAAATDRFRAPHRPIAGFPPEQTVLTKTVHHVADVDTDPSSSAEFRRHARERGFRSVLSMPMLRGGDPVGVIVVSRAQAGPFSTAEVELLHTFADQAVIAIENVRLFTELQENNLALIEAHAHVTEALEQQTATAEILRVISRSQTDVQPVFDTIARSAVKLCDGLFSALFQFDGELLHRVAQHNYTPEALEELQRVFPARPTRALFSGRAILERAVVHIPDSEVDPEHQHRALRRAIGWRSGLFVPMLREGAPIGVIEVARAEPGPFSNSEIELLKTFADQAVIAIENVRLFKELEARTGELTRSVDQLTALGEISQAVSSTLDVETVLQTIVSRASQLAGADGCAIYEYDDATEAFHIRATHNLDPILVETLRAAPLRKGEGAMGRAAETREPTQIADIAAPDAYQSHIRDTLLRAGYRALLSVPLLREGEIIGSLSLNRHTPGEFSPEAVEVLKTFATQSALAIQNARLFREIADKSRQLEAASRHKSEFLANMSHELRTPLNAIIGFSEVLAQGMFGAINDKQTEYLQDILESGRHLLSLINDILDLSKIEAGRMELEPSDFDLPSAIENALILVRERASRRGITLGSIIDEHLGIIRGDERKVKQVLLNLLSNALKFTPEGGRIDVGACLADQMAEVSVADTGIGIAPGDQETVFEEFRQVGTADEKAEGTGLGLTLSRKFIELHGGRIWVASQVGVGSTFTFTLPMRGDK
jgi:GAF domain-containing protein